MTPPRMPKQKSAGRRRTETRQRVQPLSLPRPRSTGPSERASGEFQHYSSSDLDVKTLLALVSKHASIVKHVCIPSYYLISDRAKDSVWFSSRLQPSPVCVRAGILVTGLSGDAPCIHLPPNLRTIVSECRRRGKRFVFFNMGLYWTATSVGHANVLLFDLQTKTIERYEPAGRVGKSGALDRRVCRRYRCASLTTIFRDVLPGWTYVGPTAMPVGAQNFADSFEGMCVTFSLYYTLLRLANPDESPVAVYRHILDEHQQGRLRDNILRLNKFASTILSGIRAGTLNSVRTRVHSPAMWAGRSD